MKFTITATKPNKKQPLYTKTIEADSKIEAYGKVKAELTYIIKCGADIKIEKVDEA